MEEENMKKILLFAIAGLALLAACNKNETNEPAPQPQKVTITLGAPAMGTKTVLTPTGSGNIGFKQAWKVGDAIALIYFHETNNLTNEKFVCAEVNPDGSAKFTCDASQIATATETRSDVNIVYPYSSEKNMSGYPRIDVRSFDGTLANLPDYCVFNAISKINSDGSIDAVTSFTNDVVILRIPAGTLLVDGATGTESITLSIGAVEAVKIGYTFSMRRNGMSAGTNNAGEYVYNLPASMTGGVLDNDVYAVWYHHDSWGACSLNVDVICNSGAHHYYNLASYNFVMGNVYTLSQATLNAGNGGTVHTY